MKIGVIGGGLTGLALAFRLTRLGHTVTVLEREKQVGGLATYANYGRFYWDRFYHVILPSDQHLIQFIQDLGLADQLRWTRTLTGFYVDKQFHSMSSSAEFLRFPPVSLLGKIRLALTIIYCSRINNWRRLEQVAVSDWLRKLSGEATYEKIWKPLLLAKLGENYQRVSAVFIWSYIKRMFSARHGSASKEQLGYVSGGYKAVFDRLQYFLQHSESEIRTNVTVNRISSKSNGGMLVEYGNNNKESFDRVIFTSPVNVLRQVAAPGLINMDNRGSDVEYLGVICMILLTRKPLVPYYVVNIADQQIPFTGIIGMSNLVSSEETAGLHITYLPKYVDSRSALLQTTDEELRNLFMQGFRLMFPDFDEKDIESTHIHRAVKVQPLQVLGYSQLVPKIDSEHPDFFVLNTAQFTHTTLNNNEVIRAVDTFLNDYGDQFLRQPDYRPDSRTRRVDLGAKTNPIRAPLPHAGEGLG
ncbi:MAG: NAD(P)/FAD-dependent oxidoreductase [Pseudomonadota bacterium]